MSILNGDLFHGTSTELKPGDTVLPPARAKAGTPNSSHPGVQHRAGTDVDPYYNASASASEHNAWEFAVMTAAKRGGRAAVYRVGTPADAHRGEEHKEVLSREGFPVHDREDIRPPETVRAKGKNMRYIPNPNGRQGTLPLNWTPPGRNAYSWGLQYGNGDHWNHPTQSHRDETEKRLAHAEQYTAQLHEQLGQRFKSTDTGFQPMLPGMRGSVKRQPKRKATP